MIAIYPQVYLGFGVGYFLNFVVRGKRDNIQRADDNNGPFSDETNITNCDSKEHLLIFT